MTELPAEPWSRHLDANEQMAEHNAYLNDDAFRERYRWEHEWAASRSEEVGPDAEDCAALERESA